MPAEGPASNARAISRDVRLALEGAFETARAAGDGAARDRPRRGPSWLAPLPWALVATLAVALVAGLVA